MKQFYFLITILLLIHCQVFGQSVPTYVPTNGLVGWWPFNGNAQDGSGNGNHLTNYGAQLTTDRFGINNSCYLFNGNSNYLSRGVFGLINCTVSIWAYTTSYPLFHPYGPPESVFFYNGYGDVAGFGLRAAHSKLLVITGGNVGDVTNSNFLPALNNWYNLVLVKSSNNYSLYSNGQLLSSGSAGMNPYAGLFVIGAGHSSDNSFSGYYSGKIDDIGIWNRALTQQEITNLYHAQSPCQVSIISQPVNQTVGTNRNVQFSVVSSDSSSTYRWQSNSGFGFQDLYNAGQYSGVNTSTLDVSNTSPQNDNQLFRCIVSTTNCGRDTSDVVTLNVNTSSTSTGVPNKFNYQSVIRDSSGQLMTNRAMGVRLSLQRGPHMTNLYTETHQLSTNSNGLLTTTIGSGQSTLGSMDTIDWSVGMVYVKSEIDLNGGSNYSLVSTRELLSVPYALYSLNSGSSTPGPVGPQGPQGPAGNDGSVGPQGPQGIQGNEGAQGIQGPQGPAGNDGAVGPQGPSGVSFPTGGTHGQALYYCNGVPTWGPCPNQPTMPTVTTNSVTLLSGNSASTGGNVTSDGGSPVTHRGVVYHTTSNPSLSSNYTVDGSGTGSFVSTLTNLAPTTTYYTRAYATNSVGTAYGNVVSFSSNLPAPAVAVGQNFGGGIVFYVDSTGRNGLVCAPFDQGSSSWGLNNMNIIGTSTVIGSGAANTAIMVGYGLSAATLCDTLTLNGFSDWFLPSIDEFNLAVLNIGGIFGFPPHPQTYWSSSQFDMNNAWEFYKGFSDVGVRPKSHTSMVRAVRAFSLGTSPNQPTMPTVTTNSVTLLPGNSASTGGNVTSDGGSPVTHRGVVYDTTSNPSLSSNYTVDGSGTGSFVSTLTNLAPTTTHYTRAYATNSVGTAYGSVVIFTTSAAAPSFTCGTSTVSDVDNNIYNTVQIGAQCWTQSNLKVSKYRNGDSITTGLSNNDWSNTFWTAIGAYAILNNDPANDVLYGKLYNNYAVTDNRGLCPTGWHVPSDGEWNVLVKYLDSNADTVCGNCVQSSSAGGALKSTATYPTLGGWPQPNMGATNSTGFTALPGSTRHDNGNFVAHNDSGHWWSSTVLSGPGAWYRVLSNTNNISRSDFGSMGRANGHSVRCLKD